MQPDLCSGFLSLLILFVGLRFLLGMLGLSGVFHGFWPGFWFAFFDRLLVGSRRRAAPGPVGCLALVALALLLFGWTATILSMVLNNGTGPIHMTGN
ncbi:MAG: hypothetical protein KF777_17335 [Planctomycetaceae bacterium]|nr:hypothetical protein [Planctomycetaceae bacterium]